MKKVKVAYSVRNNLGDSINPLIIEDVLGYKVEWADEFNCHTSGIGSGLRRFIIPRKRLLYSKNNVKRFVKGRTCSEPLQIWSAGFTYYPKSKEISIRSNVNFSSVRGELTKKRLEKVFNKKLDITTGDGGLLSSELIKKQNKKYSVGIIPHDSERNVEVYKELKRNINKSIVLDVRDNPIKVIEQMSACEIIITSSLHGLIIADSLGIPNKRLVVTDNLSGDGYKFDDYYSSYDISSEYLDLRTNIDINLQNIIEKYQVTEKMVDLKKNEIHKAFSANL